MYGLDDAALIFEASRRTIQSWMDNGKLIGPGSAWQGRFLSQDLEKFLRSSKRKSRRRQATLKPYGKRSIRRNLAQLGRLRALAVREFRIRVPRSEPPCDRRVTFDIESCRIIRDGS